MLDYFARDFASAARWLLTFAGVNWLGFDGAHALFLAVHGGLLLTLAVIAWCLANFRIVKVKQNA